MKKTLTFILSLLIVLTSFCSCKSNESSKNEEGKINIVTTIFPYYDFTKNIVGDKANVNLLLSPGSEPHNFEPTPSQIMDINNCDLFIYTGGESDSWAESITKSLDSNVKVLKLIECVQTYNEEEPDKTQSEGIDEHIWTSPINAINITKAISQEIEKLNTEYKDEFKSNAEEYLNKLQQLDESFKEIVENGQRKKIVFGDRFPIIYLVKEFDLDYETAFSGCSHETEPGIATINRLIDVVKNENIPVVFYLDFSNRSIADLLCEDTNAKAMIYHSCNNVTVEDFENGESYISLMKENAQALKEALN